MISRKVLLLPENEPHPSPDVLVERVSKLLGRQFPDDQAIAVLSLEEVEESIRLWEAELPMIVPHYAVKCNFEPAVLNLLCQNTRVHFDCACAKEMSMILSRGVSPSRIIVANPKKPTETIRFAANEGVVHHVVDSVNELEKIHRLIPHAKILIRLAPIHEDALITCKFGATLVEAETILQRAAELGIGMSGLSFHVGTNMETAKEYLLMLRQCQSMLRRMRESGHPVKFLDVGGGFPCAVKHFKEIAADLRRNLQELFSSDEWTGLRFIAEPGRFIASRCTSLIATIISVKETQVVDHSSPEHSNQINMSYFLNDGAFGNYHYLITKFTPLKPEDMHLLMFTPAKENSPTSLMAPNHRPILKSTVFGPCLTGVDVLFRGIRMPRMWVGERVFFHNQGAYSLSYTTNFNNMYNTLVVYVTTPTHQKFCEGDLLNENSETSLRRHLSSSALNNSDGYHEKEFHERDKRPEKKKVLKQRKPLALNGYHK